MPGNSGMSGARFATHMSEYIILICSAHGSAFAGPVIFQSAPFQHPTVRRRDLNLSIAKELE